LQLPKPDPVFRGKIGESYKDSKPDFPESVQASKGSPNVLLILLDDVGFGMCSTFGGPVPTPHMDKLANNVTIQGTKTLPEGKVTLSTDFTPDGSRQGSGTLKLFVNGQPAGEGKVERSTFRHGLEPFEVGRDSITPVDPAYKGKGSFPFTGTIDKVEFQIK
jgi:Sulfatase